MKRLFDILVALAALAILCLPFLVIAVILRCSGEGKVWFRQERVGLAGRHFKVFKFVTMYEGSEHKGDKDITVPEDPRVLPVGRVLRNLKINELPQFINVLLGDMSMVGWRPLLPQGFCLYADEVQKRILRVKPGLTGIGSLAFNHEDEIVQEAKAMGQNLRTCYRDEIMPYKGALECWYVANQSMCTDLKIIIATGYVMLRRRSVAYRKWFRGLPEPESELVGQFTVKGGRRNFHSAPARHLETDRPNVQAGRRVRILYLHQFFATPKSSFGTRSYEFARRFVKKGHDVRMITTPAYMPEKYRKSKKALRTREFEGVDTVILPITYANQMPFFKRIIAFLRFAISSSIETLRYKPDVIFATSTPLTIVIPALVAKIRWRKPMVFEVRDLWPEAPIAVGAIKNPIVIWIARGMEWLAYHSAAHVVALSEDMKIGVERRGIKAEKISVIPNSSDTSFFDVPASQGDSVRRRLGLAETDRLLVYTGTFGIVNEVTYLVRVAAAMRQITPRIKILLVGSGNRKDEAVALANELGVLGGNLYVWDPVPKTEVPDILAAASIASSTVQNNEALWPNSANKIFDAMASGTPIAINHLGWQAALINETGAGVVMTPGDPVEGAKKLAEFMLDEERLNAGAAAAKELGQTRFCRDRLAEQLEQVLQDAAINNGFASPGREESGRA